MTSYVTKKTNLNKTFNVWAHDLRTKDETICISIRAKNEQEAKEFFLEDFQKEYYFIQEIELV